MNAILEPPMATSDSAAAQRLMARHARSFAPAARLLAQRDRDRVARLYAICRSADDLADEAPVTIGRQRLAAIHAGLDSTIPSEPIAREARALFAKHPQGLVAFTHLIDTLYADLEPLELDDLAALEAYADGVAGTVGEMICALFAIDPDYRTHAIALGRAMQFTNIARDVHEDARRDRRYLPGSLCPATPAAIAADEGEALESAAHATRELLTRADALYRHGRQGLVALPLRLRLAVAIAARLYQDIGRVVRRQSADPRAPRAVVGRARKCLMAMHGMADALLAARLRRPR